MSIHEPVYASREMIKRALDINETARVNEQVDRLLLSSSRMIDGTLHRTFYPRFSTFQLEEGETWLDDREVISLISLSYNGVPVPTNDYVLKPFSGPPYNRIELGGSTSSAIRMGGSLSGYAMFGYTLDLQPVGILLGSINDSTESLSVSNGSSIGVGDLLRIDSEYLLVYGRTWIDSAQDLQTGLVASTGNVTVSVDDASTFSIGETITIGVETMWIVDIIGDALAVRRSWDGSVLAVHDVGSKVYVNRGLAVRRSSIGSTGNAHTSGTEVYQWVPPSLITQLSVAETLNAIEQEQSGYARVVGSGDRATEPSGAGLSDVRDRARTAYGRKARMRSV